MMQQQFMQQQQHMQQMVQQQQQMQLQLQQQQPQQTTSDEGFIDEPDCDCDARNNFGNDGNAGHANSATGTSGSDDLNRVPPFQYCYNCAPFHSNGRGPTLVPSPPSPAAATSPRSQTRAQSSEGDEEAADAAD